MGTAAHESREKENQAEGTPNPTQVEHGRRVAKNAFLYENKCTETVSVTKAERTASNTIELCNGGVHSIHCSRSAACATSCSCNTIVLWKDWLLHAQVKEQNLGLLPCSERDGPLTLEAGAIAGGQDHVAQRCFPLHKV